MLPGSHRFTFPATCCQNGIIVRSWVQCNRGSDRTVRPCVAWAIVMGGAAHQFNYLPDLAQALVTLGELDVAETMYRYEKSF
jgi:hypothetical protein